MGLGPPVLRKKREIEEEEKKKTEKKKKGNKAEYSASDATFGVRSLKIRDFRHSKENAKGRTYGRMDTPSYKDA